METYLAIVQKALKAGPTVSRMKQGTPMAGRSEVLLRLYPVACCGFSLLAVVCYLSSCILCVLSFAPRNYYHILHPNNFTTFSGVGMMVLSPVFRGYVFPILYSHGYGRWAFVSFILVRYCYLSSISFHNFIHPSSQLL